MRSFEPSVDVLSNSANKKSVPYSSELTQAADMLRDDVIEAVNSDKMATVEAVGTLSMASLVKGAAEGTIPLAKAFTILKGLAERKTPDPIQRIEARHEVDMRAILISAIAENPQALERAADMASVARERVKQRLGATDDSLTLSPPARDDLPEKTLPGNVSDEQPFNPPTSSGLESFTLPKTEWQPGESPSEIQELSDAGINK